ncbi:MoaD/ThiS family protein [Phycicoccus duodecadis]|uniref:MoaD/ThiS family protein n=1 Tax=Phycicoccus duodecadis TaxID=173053 RepID=UPI001FE3FA7B|nr:MoaD/ThiS family protein [Phycicoccus duodecadis]
MATATVTVRFWAGARAATGIDAAEVEAPPTVGGLQAALVAAHPALEAVLPVCTLLVDGLAASGPDAALAPGALVEVLPPFAGG